MMNNNVPTKLVNIYGEIPNVKLQILDNHGDLRTYRITSMVLDSHKIEYDYSRREYRAVYYKGRVEIVDRFQSHEKTFWFKYIPASKKWFICGNYDVLIKVIEDRPWYYR